ncbi:hypothetical protein KXR83_14120 [Williamsia muralis]
MTRISNIAVLCDLEANLGLLPHRELSKKDLLSCVLTLRFVSVFLFRVAQAVGRRTTLVAGIIKQFNQFVTGADVAWQAKIGPGLILYHPNGVVIGPFCSVGHDCSIQQGVTLGGNGSREGGATTSPTVGSRVTIGSGAKVFGAIHVDNDCIIGANAVVNRSSGGTGRLAVGVPARWRDLDTGSGRSRV